MPAAVAKKILAEFKPEFPTKENYFAFVDKLNLDCDAVSYEGDGKVVLTYEEG